MANRKFRSEVDFDWQPFRHNFKRLLDSHSLTMTEFAREVNMSPGTITRWLYERTPDILALCVVADYFSVNVDWLIGRSNNRYEAISDEEKTILDRFQIASEPDKTAVNAILSKYA